MRRQNIFRGRGRFNTFAFLRILILRIEAGLEPDEDYP